MSGQHRLGHAASRVASAAMSHLARLSLAERVRCRLHQHLHIAKQFPQRQRRLRPQTQQATATMT